MSSESTAGARRFGQYTLIKKLATGGMAEIWLASQRGLADFNRFVVIKKILSHLAAEETFVTMFLDEARTSAQLSHPNIAQIYDLGKEGDTYFIAMEYVAGENLAAIRWRGRKQNVPLPLGFACRIMADACKALHYAHHLKGPDGRPLGIVHRDVSPQNILATYEGEVKVVDFGIAKAATKSEQTRTGMLKGKFSYMSPEQCRAESVDHRSDVFALGIVLYELATGKRLFKHDSELMILEMITKGSVPPPSQHNPEIPAGLDQIILRALEKDPAQRFSTAQEMQIAIEELLRASKLPSSSAQLAEYMRTLFSDSIEEKRQLRESAARGDLREEVDQERTDQRALPRPGARPSPVSSQAMQVGMPGRNAPPATQQGAPTPQSYVGPPQGPVGSYAGHPPAGSYAGHPPAGSYAGHPPAGSYAGHPPAGSYAGYPPVGSYAGYVPTGTSPGQYVQLPDGTFALRSQLTPMPKPKGSGLAAKIIAGVAVLGVIGVIGFVGSTMMGEPEVLLSVKKGALQLDTVPSGARIFRDGQPLLVSTEGTPAVTPVRIADVAYGTQLSLRFEKEGHEPKSVQLLMDANLDDHQHVVQLDPKLSVLVVDVTGDRANESSVYLDDRQVGTGPTLKTEQPPGQYRLDVRVPGGVCRAPKDVIALMPGAALRLGVDCVQRPRGRPQTDRTDTTPEPDGDKTAPVAQTDPAPVEQPPPKPEKEKCEINPNQSNGELAITTEPYSDIFFQGKKLGQTPLRVELPAGCVVITAVSPEDKTKKKMFRVKIIPGDVTKMIDIEL